MITHAARGKNAVGQELGLTFMSNPPGIAQRCGYMKYEVRAKAEIDYAETRELRSQGSHLSTNLVLVLFHAPNVTVRLQTFQDVYNKDAESFVSVQSEKS